MYTKMYRGKRWGLEECIVWLLLIAPTDVQSATDKTHTPQSHNHSCVIYREKKIDKTFLRLHVFDAGASANEKGNNETFFFFLDESRNIKSKKKIDQNVAIPVRRREV